MSFECQIIKFQWKKDQNFHICLQSGPRWLTCPWQLPLSLLGWTEHPKSRTSSRFIFVNSDVTRCSQNCFASFTKLFQTRNLQHMFMELFFLSHFPFQKLCCNSVNWCSRSFCSIFKFCFQPMPKFCRRPFRIIFCQIFSPTSFLQMISPNCFCKLSFRILLPPIFENIFSLYDEYLRLSVFGCVQSIAHAQVLHFFSTLPTSSIQGVFSKGPTQKSSKYEIGPSHQDKIAKSTGPTQSYQRNKK